jgi:hypothetical protein
MVNYRIILILVLLISSCSAEWHLKKAISKNPKYGDSTKIYVPYRKDTTIYVEIPGKLDSNQMAFKEWYLKVKDSTATVYRDSFLYVYQQLDSLGNLKTKIVNVPYKVEVPVVIHDTIPVKVPPKIIVKEKGWTTIDWVLLSTSLLLFLLLIILNKKK